MIEKYEEEATDYSYVIHSYKGNLYEVILFLLNCKREIIDTKIPFNGTLDECRNYIEKNKDLNELKNY